MRTAILLSGILISDAIRRVEYTYSFNLFVAVVLIASIVMDFMDFINKEK